MKTDGNPPDKTSKPIKEGLKNDDLENGRKNEKNLLKWSGLKKPRKGDIGKDDDEVMGSAEVVRCMRYFSVLGVVAKEFKLKRGTLIFLIGHYIKNLQVARHGRAHASLQFYITDTKQFNSKVLLGEGFIRRINPGIYELTEKGNQCARRFINAMRYSQEIDRNRWKDLGGNGYTRD